MELPHLILFAFGQDRESRLRLKVCVFILFYLFSVYSQIDPKNDLHSTRFCKHSSKHLFYFSFALYQKEGEGESLENAALDAPMSFVFANHRKRDKETVDICYYVIFAFVACIGNSSQPYLHTVIETYT